MLHVHGRQYLCNQIEQWHINDHGEHAQDSTGTVPFSEIPSQQSLALLQRIAQRIIPLSQCPST